MRQRSERRDLGDDGICRGQRDSDDGLVLGVGDGNKEAEAELEEKMRRSDADGRHGAASRDSKTPSSTDFES
jgi:hypothetical protein